LAHATAGFHAVGDLFERGWGWGPGEEEEVVEWGDIIDDSSRGTEAATTRKGENRVRGREGRNRLARGRRGAPPQARRAHQEVAQVIGPRQPRQLLAWPSALAASVMWSLLNSASRGRL
jgi:hypothetical protein